MQKYELLYSDEALLDLKSIENYIVYQLKNPDAAWNTVDGIMNTIDKIPISPFEHPLVLDPYLSDFGIRLTSYKNYNILYIIKKLSLEIYIVRIFYNRRDWKSLLKRDTHFFPVK